MENQIYVLHIDDETYKIEDYSQDAVYELLTDNCYFSIDIFNEIPASNKVVGDGFDWDDLNEVFEVIDAKFKDIYAKVTNEEDIEVASYQLSVLYKKYAEDSLGSENGDIIACSLWSEQLDNFIKNAEWHIAMESSDGTLLSDIKDWPYPTINDTIMWLKDGIEYVPKLWYGFSDAPILDSRSLKIFYLLIFSKLTHKSL